MALSNLFRDEKFPYSMTTYGREKKQRRYKENTNINSKLFGFGVEIIIKRSKFWSVSYS
jgi:hypothetical protein